MIFATLCELFEQVAATSSVNRKVKLVAGFLRSTPLEEIPIAVHALVGSLISRGTGAPTNVGYATILKVAQQVAGVTDDALEEARKAHGDLGGAIEALFQDRKVRQATLFASQPPTIQEVAKLFDRLQVTGPGSVARKKQWLGAFLARLTGQEAKYFIRLLLGWLNIGLQSPLVLRAIASVARVPEESLRRAVMKYPDAGELAKIALTEGVGGLDNVQITPLIPVLPMLAMQADSLQGAIHDFGGTLAAEYKYDGLRLQVHQAEDRVEVFSRRLTRLTDQFPDIVEAWQEVTPGTDCVVEGELVGLLGDRIAPFQVFMQRLRTYGVADAAERVPAAVFLFDILYFEDRDVTALSYADRYAILEQKITPNDTIHLATRKVSSDAAELQEFFDVAVAAGCEGLMLKDLRANYMPGTRGTRMLKYKKTLDTLDLVLVGAEYGEGKKSALLSRLFFAAWDETREKLTTVAKVSTGLTDAETQEISERITPLVVREEGRRVEVVPKLVCEILADEILESPRFEGGYALRFARITRIRDDLSVEDADDAVKILQRYSTQRSRTLRLT
ncbi:MAG TPA: ATP-dependent DNA ligase [Candidatus Lokiarchaeia archaeon]|nr:ATP-dependent DNA ligase [Candidatus Lokiarchaeia archaeon]